MYSKKNSFTLIELLVVVAIIAVLVAILLPALNNAREQARKVTCASNLRQVGNAIVGYRNDWSGFMPAGWDGVWTWEETLAPYVGFPKKLMRQPLSGYPVYYCQSNMEHANTNGYGTNYATNGQLFPNTTLIGYDKWPWLKTQMNESQINQPSRTFVMAENGFNSSNPYGQAGLTPLPHGIIWLPHPGPGCNLAFFDGHARFITMDWHERLPVATQDRDRIFD